MKDEIYRISSFDSTPLNLLFMTAPKYMKPTYLHIFTYSDKICKLEA